jgi:Holliday junction resolvase RusA-like endonuclease
MIRLIIPGAPIGKMSAKAQRLGKFIRHYDPQEKEKLRVRQVCKEQIDKELGLYYTGIASPKIEMEAIHFQLDVNFEVTYVFILPYPRFDNQSALNAFKWQSKIKSKPDIDNLLKFYNDVLTGLIWVDDKFISKISAIKVYGDKPRTEILIKMTESQKPDPNQKAIMNAFTPDEFIAMAQMIDQIAILGPKESADEIVITPEYLSKLIEFCHRYHKEIKKIARHVDENNKEKNNE